MTQPMNPEKLADLAARCEQATGPDRELDVAILTTALGYRDVHGDGRMFDLGNDGYWFVDDCSIDQLPSPTASLDAAMSLWPDEAPHLIPSDPRICAAMALRSLSGKRSSTDGEGR